MKLVPLLLTATIIPKTISKKNTKTNFCVGHKNIIKILTNIAPSKKDNIYYNKNPFINKSFRKTIRCKIKNLSLTKIVLKKTEEI